MKTWNKHLLIEIFLRVFFFRESEANQVKYAKQTAEKKRDAENSVS